MYIDACLPFFHNAFNEPHKVYITFIFIQQWSFPLPLKYYRSQDGVLQSTSLNFEIEIPTSNPSLPSHLVETMRSSQISIHPHIVVHPSLPPFPRCLSSQHSTYSSMLAATTELFILVANPPYLRWYLKGCKCTCYGCKNNFT